MRLPVLVLCAAVLGTAAVPSALAQDHAVAPRGAPVAGPIIQMFQWPWDSIARECTDHLGPKGFGAVQVSPPQEHVELSGAGYPWYQDYQPVSYQVQSRRGDRAQFASMVKTCNAAGVQIYADAVINHMAGADGAQPGSAGTTYTKYNYPGTYQDQDFHDCRRNIANYNDKNEVRTCELSGLADLKTESDHVRTTERNYLNDLISLGVSGFRVDGAKHMAPEDLGAIFGSLNSLPNGQKPYVFQEVIADSGTSASEYTGNGDVTEFAYHGQVSNAFKNGSLAGLRSLPDSMTLPSEQAVVFVDNHDTQRSDPVLTYKDGAAYDLGVAFELGYPYGTPQLISSFAFDNTQAGPPAGADGTTKPASCDDSAWVCEQRHPIIAGMAGFHKAVAGTQLTDWWDDGGGQIAFGRGDRGYLVINREGGELSRSFQTSLPAGKYCDVMSGELAGGACTGQTIEVGPDGSFTAKVPANSGLALHAGAKLG